MKSRNNSRRSRKNPKKNVAKQYNQPLRPIALAPPRYVQQEVRSWKVRGRITAAETLAIYTVTQLSMFLGVISTGAATTNFLAQQFRIKRIAAWAPVATAGTEISLTLKWADVPTAAAVGIASPPVASSDSSISFDRPAFAVLTPHKGSYFNNWFDCNCTANCLVATWPVGTVIDIDYQFFLDDIGSLQAGPASAGLTAGNIYHHLIGSIIPVSPLNAAP